MALNLSSISMVIPEPRADLPRLSGGRSGRNVKDLTGPPDSAIRGFDGRVYVTDSEGRVVLDLTRERAKPVEPGIGFGPKRPPTPDELNLIEKTHENR